MKHDITNVNCAKKYPPTYNNIPVLEVLEVSSGPHGNSRELTYFLCFTILYISWS